MGLRIPSHISFDCDSFLYSLVSCLQELGLCHLIDILAAILTILRSVDGGWLFLLQAYRSGYQHNFNLLRLSTDYHSIV